MLCADMQREDISNGQSIGCRESGYCSVVENCDFVIGIGEPEATARIDLEANGRAGWQTWRE
jgi:hypothetical protein